MTEGIRILEKKHMVSILLFVAERGGCTRMELYDGVANNDRMPDKLEILEDAGLIKQSVIERTRAVKIELTPMGSEVVAKLSEANDLMISGNRAN